MNPHDPRTWPSLTRKRILLKQAIQADAWAGRDTSALERSLATVEAAIRSGQILEVPF